MSHLKEHELNSILNQLPDIEELEQVNALKAADLFLCALGFEPRCLSAPKRLRKLGFRAARCLYLEPSTNPRDNQMNLRALMEHLRALSKYVEPLPADELEFSERLRRLLSVMASEKPGNLRVVADISVFPNRLVMRVMKVILESDVELTIVYSEAKTYHPTIEEWQENPDEWRGENSLGLERGVATVMPSREYPGQHLDPLPDFLILFPTFKAQRTRAVIARVDQSLLAVPGDKIVWLIGKPHLDENNWRTDALKELNGIAEAAPQIEVSTFNYKEVMIFLEQIHTEKCMDYNISISPLGSKLQALGTALSCYMHPDMRVMIAIPKEYNAVHYSEGCRTIWQINFGKSAVIRALLDKVGSLEIEA